MRRSAGKGLCSSHSPLGTSEVLSEGIHCSESCSSGHGLLHGVVPILFASASCLHVRVIRGATPFAKSGTVTVGSDTFSRVEFHSPSVSWAIRFFAKRNFGVVRSRRERQARWLNLEGAASYLRGVRSQREAEEECKYAPASRDVGQQDRKTQN